MKGNCWIFGWHSATPQLLEYKTARRKTYYSWYNHYYAPFSEKFNIFKHVIQSKLSHFPRHFGKVKARSFQIYSIYWKVDYQHCWTLATFLFENSCCCFLKTL